MPRVYELPTHLHVADVLIAGLTARRLLRLIIGASLAYGLWDQALWLPDYVRLALAASVALIGVAAGLVEWNGWPGQASAPKLAVNLPHILTTDAAARA